MKMGFCFRFGFKEPLTWLTWLTLLALLLSPIAFSQTRIMPLGDSITGSPGCWRASLWTQLQDSGYSNIDFVGTLPPQGCGQAHDGDNEGHGGILATNMASQNQLVRWLSQTNPDVVIMHLGTNDIWSNRSNEAVLAAFTKLVGQMRDNNPAMQILVAQIIPMDPAQTCSDCNQRVQSLNNALPQWAADLTTPASPITLVDHYSGFSYASDTHDGVHPNAEGHQKMADVWYDALHLVLSSGSNGVTSPPTTPPSSDGRERGRCNWYGTRYPLCADQEGGWGRESNETCIGIKSCSGQPSPYGPENGSDPLPSTDASNRTREDRMHQRCNWYGSLYPVCLSRDTGWGYENSQSCIGATTCSSQESGGGIVAATAAKTRRPTRAN